MTSLINIYSLVDLKQDKHKKTGRWKEIQYLYSFILFSLKLFKVCEAFGNIRASDHLSALSKII